MRPIKLTYTAMLLAVAAIMAGCSDEPVERDNGSAYVSFGISASGSLSLDWEAGAPAGSRALALPPIEPPMTVKPANIGVWGFNDQSTDPVFSNRLMVYLYGPEYALYASQLGGWSVPNEYPYANPEKWVPSTESTPSRYKFFAYSPYVATGDPDTDEVIAYSEDFDGFRAFIRHHLPRYTDIDYLVSRNILNYTSVKADHTNPVQRLEMDHLYSRLRFCFILGPRFGDLREIHIKSIMISGLMSDELMLTSTFTLVTGANGAPALDAAGNYQYVCTRTWDAEPAALPSEPLTFSLDFDPDLTGLSAFRDPGFPVVDETGDLLLTARNREHYGYLPLASLYTIAGEPLQSVDISVVYDVYDKEGLLLRANETATNSVQLDFVAASAEGRKLEPGHYYDVKIEIEPKFLFVMLDNDVFPDGKITIP